MKITQMTSPRTGKAVANQFKIDNQQFRGYFGDFFQSYDSVICFKPYGIDNVVLDETYWNYSKTTSKYRTQFLGESTKETQEKINSGEYVLTNLN